MGAEKSLYFDLLYPLQDSVLQVIGALDTGFYLTGGTASSRGYLHHRFSDDLDLFVNDDAHFGLWSDRVIHALAAASNWRVDVGLREARFVRLVLHAGDIDLKLELVNDVPSHVGEIRAHETLGRLDSAENILANKLTALADRQEPKDLADVWGFCRLLGLSITQALEGAHSKASGLFPVDLARVLLGADRSDWQLVRWVEPPDPDRFLGDLRALGEELLLLG